MRIIKVSFMLLLIIAVSCKKEPEAIIEVVDQSEPLSGKEINQVINQRLSESGSFSWMDVDDYTLWSAAMRGDSILTVGYGEHSFNNHKSTQLENQKSDLLAFVRGLEGATSQKSGRDVLIYEDEILNFVDVYVGNLRTITELRQYEGLRYVEPAGYRYFQYEDGRKSSSGCDNDPVSVNSYDYRSISPNCLVSWTYDKHNIPSAWSHSTGSGIGVGLIDTGVSSSQSMFGSNFNDGYSSGRSISKYGVYVSSAWPWSTKTDGVWDKCGHGSLMAGTIASPRNDNGLPVGVAYNCNLVSYRATKNVVLDGYHEQKGVARALTELGNRGDVKIISMSIGHVFSVGRIKDAVKYAYARGKMIIAAGGTSTSFTNFAGVIFPASMSETVAVTGIQDGSGYTECDVCHKGSEIDFTVIMEHYYNTDRHSVCLGFYEGSRTYVGGSSVATATTAGIAALIWSKHPTWSRSQVLTKMRQSADYYPNKHSKFGYGSIDALAAVQ